ncbi:MAG: hypothetical protein K5655_04345 [Lachnospiraceae bacterium]|nr:hypothetical protein [Lachnospiraceae bacterium]
MAQSKSANSTSKHTTAEMREWYEAHKTAIEKYEQIKNGISLIDPKKDVNRTFTVFKRDTLRNYMKNPLKNYVKLIELSRFLYLRSNPYRKIIAYNSSMINVNYRSIIPKQDWANGKSPEEVLNEYTKTCKFFNVSDMQAEIYKMCIIAWREDTAFGCIYHNDDGVFILPIPYDICKVDGIYNDGGLSYAVKMNYFDKHKDELEFYGEPFTSMYRDYQNDTQNGLWQHMPDKYCFCIKVSLDDPILPLPPYMPLFNSIINLCDTEDLQADKEKASVYKLLAFELEPDDSQDPDSFKVDVETAVDYYNQACERLPEYVDAIITPVKITPISFKDDQASDINIIENATKTLYNSSGGAQILNSSSISTTIGWMSALIADEQYGTNTLRAQIQNFFNRWIQFYQKSNCELVLLPVSPYTKQNYIEQLKSQFTYGVPLRMALGALDGFNEMQIMSLANLENNVLKLNEVFIPPQSSNTQSGGGESSEVGQGRPTIDNPAELTDEGDASRSKG